MATHRLPLLLPLLRRRNASLSLLETQAGKALLKTDYVEDSSVEACLKLAVKVLNKTMDSTTPSPEKMEFTTITRVDGKVSRCGWARRDSFIAPLCCLTIDNALFSETERRGGCKHVPDDCTRGRNRTVSGDLEK